MKTEEKDKEPRTKEKGAIVWGLKEPSEQGRRRLTTWRKRKAMTEKEG
jgi:hypothetical protein